MPKLAFDFTLVPTDPEMAKDAAVSEWMARVEEIVKDKLESLPYNPVLHKPEVGNKLNIIF